MAPSTQAGAVQAPERPTEGTPPSPSQPRLAKLADAFIAVFATRLAESLAERLEPVIVAGLERWAAESAAPPPTCEGASCSAASSPPTLAPLTEKAPASGPLSPTLRSQQLPARCR